MKEPQSGHNWFFVDESGDPVFYNRRGNLVVGREGCSPILLLGFIETQQPQVLRQALLNLQQEIVRDPYFAGVPSLAKTAVSFHAKDDLPEIRYQVYKLLATLDFKAQFIVARKRERIFLRHFHGSQNAFYDALITKLFRNVLHRYQHNSLYFAKRESSARQTPLRLAINKAVLDFEEQWQTKVETKIHVQAQKSSDEPCLSIVDYMNWAVYRAYTQQEMRYFNTVRERVSFLVDLYDTDKYPTNWYGRKNPFDISKASPL